VLRLSKPERLITPNIKDVSAISDYPTVRIFIHYYIVTTSIHNCDGPSGSFVHYLATSITAHIATINAPSELLCPSELPAAATTSNGLPPPLPFRPLLLLLPFPLFPGATPTAGVFVGLADDLVSVGSSPSSPPLGDRDVVGATMI